PTVWASAAIANGGGWGAMLADLASGRSVGTVALGAPLAAEPTNDGTLLVSGSTGPLLGGALAGVVVAPVSPAGDGERWCVLGGQGDGVTAVPLASLDATRRLARLEFADVPVPPERLLPELTRDRVRALLATLTAAEC